MPHPLPVAIVADETGERREIFLGAVHFKIKVGFDFEGLTKIGIDGCEVRIETTDRRS